MVSISKGINDDRNNTRFEIDKGYDVFCFYLSDRSEDYAPILKLS